MVVAKTGQDFKAFCDQGFQFFSLFRQNVHTVCVLRVRDFHNVCISCFRIFPISSFGLSSVVIEERYLIFDTYNATRNVEISVFFEDVHFSEKLGLVRGMVSETRPLSKATCAQNQQV